MQYCCFANFASAFDAMGRGFLWGIMAANGMLHNLLKLIKAYYASIKVRVKASGGEIMLLEIRSGDPYSLACSPAFGRDVKYRCIQIAGFP